MRVATDAAMSGIRVAAFCADVFAGKAASLPLALVPASFAEAGAGGAYLHMTKVGAYWYICFYTCSFPLT